MRRGVAGGGLRTGLPAVITWKLSCCVCFLPSVSDKPLPDCCGGLCPDPWALQHQPSDVNPRNPYPLCCVSTSSLL